MTALEREHNYREKSLPRGELARDKVGDAPKVVSVDCVVIYNDPSYLFILPIQGPYRLWIRES